MKGANSVEGDGVAASLTGRSAVVEQGVWSNFWGGEKQNFIEPPFDN
mgnify:FL=1